jgi:hypothetical protein
VKDVDLSYQRDQSDQRPNQNYFIKYYHVLLPPPTENLSSRICDVITTPNRIENCNPQYSCKVKLDMDADNISSFFIPHE